jgi:Na+-translocating ferredoxin:NAD+ oxidoreductase subunit D
MKLNTTMSPHMHRSDSTQRIMLKVGGCAALGLLPLTYWFGWGSCLQVLLCIAFCWLFEALCLQLRQRAIVPTLQDNTALVCAMLLGLSLPPYAPWWIACIGSFFAIVVAKQVYGGLGQNLFNPAMCGYVVLLVSFPAIMSAWPLPADLVQSPYTLLQAIQAVLFEQPQGLPLGYDGISMATPLDTLKTDASMDISRDQTYARPLFEGINGWAWVNLTYLVAGLLLVRLQATTWHIPACVLISLSFCSGIHALIAPDTAITPWVHALSGATFFGAFFIATDPVSTASSWQGRCLFGCLVGCLIFLIRTLGGYPDGVAFAVLLGNLCVPLIDHFVRPTTYGYAR